MSLIALLALAFAMAADAFAVSVSHGARLKTMRWGEATRIAIVFGAMQGLMPLIGWYLGRAAAVWVETWGRYIAFALLAGVALKMLKEARSVGDDDALGGEDGRVSNLELLVAGVATSLDALAAGVGLAFVDLSISQTAAVIAFCTFVLSLLGVWLGRQIGTLVGKGAEYAGAIILLVLAVSFLLR